MHKKLIKSERIDQSTLLREPQPKGEGSKQVLVLKMVNRQCHSP